RSPVSGTMRGSLFLLCSARRRTCPPVGVSVTSAHVSVGYPTRIHVRNPPESGQKPSPTGAYPVPWLPRCLGTADPAPRAGSLAERGTAQLFVARGEGLPRSGDDGGWRRRSRPFLPLPSPREFDAARMHDDAKAVLPQRHQCHEGERGVRRPPVGEEGHHVRPERVRPARPPALAGQETGEPVAGHHCPRLVEGLARPA